MLICPLWVSVPVYPRTLSVVHTAAHLTGLLGQCSTFLGYIYSLDNSVGVRGRGVTQP